MAAKQREVVSWDDRIAKAAIDYWSAKDAKTRAAALARYQGLQAMRELEEHRAKMAVVVDHSGDAHR